MNAIRIGVCAAVLALFCGGVAAQGYPLKPPRIVVGFAPGGNTDLVTRILAQKLGELWSQTVVVDNRPGASGMIAGEIVAKAAPDGYTLLLTPQTSIAVAPSLYGKAPYDPAKDFAPITLAGSSPLLMVVHPSFPPKSFAEFVALAKKGSAGALTFGSGGIGSSPHMAGELFRSMAHIDITHIPYRGNGPAYTDLMAGQVSLMFPNIATSLQYVKTGRMRALGVGGKRRSVIAPDIPTINESGLPGYEMSSWFGLLAPAGTPPAVINRLQQEIGRMFRQAEVREKLFAQGVEPVGSTPQEFAAFLNAETAQWAKVIKATGLKPE